MLSSTEAVYDPVAMLSRSMGSRMEDVCAATGKLGRVIGVRIIL